MARTSVFGRILGSLVAPFVVILKVRSFSMLKIAGLARCELITLELLNLSPFLFHLSLSNLIKVFPWLSLLASQILFSSPTTMGFVQLNLLLNSFIIDNKCLRINRAGTGFGRFLAQKDSIFSLERYEKPVTH